MNKLHKHITTRLVDNRFIAKEIADFDNGDYPDNFSFLALKRESGNNTRYEVFLAITEEVRLGQSFIVSERRLTPQSKGFRRVFGKSGLNPSGVTSLHLSARDFEAIAPFVQVFDSIEEITVAMGSDVAYYYQDPQ